MMKLTISDARAEARGDFGRDAITLVMSLEGRKKWVTDKHLRFEATEHNIRSFRSIYEEADVKDARPPISKVVEAIANYNASDFKFRIEPFDFQLKNFIRFKDQDVFAIFSEQGTGKTKTLFDIISYRVLKGTLTGVLLFSSPKGVHAQWIEEQMPKHLWKEVTVQAAFWEKNKFPWWIGKRGNEMLQIFSANIDALKSKKFMEGIMSFINCHKGKLMIAVDESQSIRNANSGRGKKAIELGKHANQRAIMTGTPIAKDLTDEWSQFKFLDERIIGQKYKVAFQAQFCRMGGYEGRQVIGHRNLPLFKELTAPYIFRATKKELNFKEPIRDRILFDMTDEQLAHQKSFKENFLTVVNDDEKLYVTHAATLLLRLQQLSCGFLVDEEGKTIPLIQNPRLDALKNLLQNTEGKMIVWCRFKYDVETIAAALGDQCVTYYGPTTPEKRRLNKAKFLQSNVPYFVATAKAAGTGVDGLQTVCSRAVYYSNSFDVIDRWQSEDRINRIGMMETPSYFDLVGRKSVDIKLLANLKAKKSFSALVLDDIKEWINEL